MKHKKIFVFVFIICIIVSINTSRDELISQNFNVKNFIILSQANASLIENEVTCKTNWNDCFFGCVTKYRCNALTECMQIMASTSSDPDEKCIPK